RDRSVPTTNRLMDFLESPDAARDVAEKADEIAKEHRFFHWPLQFPEVFEKRGFDLVIGNPPWERIKLQEQEFFAVRDPDIANAPNKAAREAMIAALAQRNPALLKAFEKAKHDAEDASLFVRASGRFPLTAVGDVNTYALFAELAVRLTNDAGSAAVIVPTGIATDDTCKKFFADLNEKRRLVSLFDFENREKLFPEVDSRQKFCLLTASAKPTAATQFAFFLTRTEHLDDKIRRFTLSADDLALINPNTRTAPVFRTKIDAELTKKIYQRVPVLVNEKTGENPWGIRFSTMFHMSNDSGLFRTAAQLEADGFVREGPNFVSDRGVYVPLYEAKMIWQFDHRYGTFEGYAERPSSQTNTPTLDQYRDVNYTVTPWYWVPKDEVENRLADWPHQWLIGFRNIARSTDERTFIASVIPRVGVGDNLPLLMARDLATPEKAACLVGNLDAVVLDFVARSKVGGVNLNFFIVQQVAALAPSQYSASDLDFIIPKVLELIYTSYDLQPFARDCGYDGPPFRWDEERRALLRAELDAYYAYLYGLNKDELLYILDPQEVYGAEFPGETFRVLKGKEMSRHGEYRTKRLVMEAWDRLFGKEARP
ncbi:MAG: Eco57I restriction-modification methylase domain-containing protein, partial [Desulfomonilaceae bacterium]